jgi:predicted ArsR family transcriptional regulator
MDAGDIAARLGCSVPAARTTLNRLVKSGHAMRTAPGWFRARSG